MVKFIAFVLLACSISANADEWTTADKQREAVYLVLHAIDWAQTRTIARNPEKYAERGIVASNIIGKYPSVGRVDAYMSSSTILTMVLSRTIPSEYREYFQYLMIGDSAYSVVHNFNIGVRIEF